MSAAEKKSQNGTMFFFISFYFNRKELSLMLYYFLDLECSIIVVLCLTFKFIFIPCCCHR
jgi:hypothetical protein